MLLGLLACSAACTTHPSANGDAKPPDGNGADASPIGDAAPFTTGVSTLAGAAETGNTDGDRSIARFSNPVNVLLGADGTLYVADFDNGRIRTVDKQGNVSTLISQPGFARPFGMAWAADGALYVQTDNNASGNQNAMSSTIWTIDVAAATATVIATNLGRPRGLAVLHDGRIAMADDLHHVIEILVPSTGAVTVLAGTYDAPGYLDATGAAARFSRPYAIGIRSDGMLVVSDFDNQRIRLVNATTGATTTLTGNGTAGYADGSLATAEFNQPQGLVIDSADDIYITDAANYRVRRIHAGNVDTVAGNGTGGYLDDNDRLAAELYGLEGMAVSADGSTLYVADGSRGDDVPYNRVRLVNMEP